MSRHVVQSMFPDVQADKFAGPLYGSVQNGTNADLIATVARTYLTGSVLDVTYGEHGGWWKRYRPERFVWHDITIDGVDFRHLPHADGEFDAVCFDPPYIPAGGERASGSTVAEAAFRSRFGVGYTEDNAPRGRAQLVKLIEAGLAECARVINRDGFLLAKGTDYTDGGRLYLGHRDFIDFAERELGLFVHDLIVHHTGSGPGGHNIGTQIRARRHHSYLMVFTKKARYS